VKILTNTRFYLVLLSLFLLTLSVKYFNLQNDLIKKQTEIDNLKDEMYVKDLNLGSYEMMWSILEEINKPLADSIDLQVE
jgi:hypothetical protein